MITPEEFDKLCTWDSSKHEWVVLPTEPLPENEEIANFIKSIQKSLIENPSIPYCAKCWKKMEIEPDHMTCPKCGNMVCFREEKE